MEAHSLHKCLLRVPSLEHTDSQLTQYPLSHLQVLSSSQPEYVLRGRSLLFAPLWVPPSNTPH